MGGERIVTLTGWTHRLHTNTKRKCVSILCVAERRDAQYVFTLEPYADGTPAPTLVTKEVDMAVAAHFLLAKA